MNYSNNHFKKLLDNNTLNLVEIFRTTVIEKSPIKNSNYIRNQKYTIDDYIIGIIDVMRYNTSWNSYNGIINGNTLRKKHNEWVKLGIYEEIYKRSLNKFLKTTPKTKELKYQSIDSTFVRDMNGCKETAYSGIYKEKKNTASKGIKITSIVTTTGVPISATIDPSNKHDSPLLIKSVEEIIPECNTYKYRNHNRYKQYLMGDSGYDSKANNIFLKKKGYIPVICPNKKNTKDPKKLRYFTKKQKKIYKKRITIENYHSWIKKFKKVSALYERNINNYKGLLLLGFSVIINRRIETIIK